MMPPHIIIKQEKIPLSLPIIKYPVIAEIEGKLPAAYTKNEIKRKQGRTQFAINDNY